MAAPEAGGVALQMLPLGVNPAPIGSSSAEALEVLDASPLATSLPDLSSDALEAVAFRASPKAVGRLRQACRALAAAAKPRHPSWVWLRNTVCERGWDPACLVAAKSGQMKAVMWAHAQGCRLDALTLYHAALGGKLDVIRAVHSLTPPCPIDSSVCMMAAHGGHLQILQFIRALSPPCPWDYGVCTNAAHSGHLTVLKWARAQSPPCEWRARLS